MCICVCLCGGVVFHEGKINEGGYSWNLSFRQLWVAGGRTWALCESRELLTTEPSLQPFMAFLQHQHHQKSVYFTGSIALDRKIHLFFPLIFPFRPIWHPAPHFLVWRAWRSCCLSAGKVPPLPASPDFISLQYFFFFWQLAFLIFSYFSTSLSKLLSEDLEEASFLDLHRAPLWQAVCCVFSCFGF